MIKSIKKRAQDLKTQTGQVVLLSSGSTRTMYFTPETQDLIIQFQGTENQSSKNRIFKKIYPAFDRIAHNLIYKYKLNTDEQSFTDLKNETVTHLYQKIHLYNPEVGVAFSYFTVTALHYLLLNKQKYQKINLNKVNLDTLDPHFSLDLEIFEQRSNSDSISANDKINKFIEYFTENIHIHFPKEGDRVISEVILQMIENNKTVELPMKKKSIYFLIMDQTACTKPDLIRVCKRLQKIYNRVNFNED